MVAWPIYYTFYQNNFTAKYLGPINHRHVYKTVFKSLLMLLGHALIGLDSNKTQKAKLKAQKSCDEQGFNKLFTLYCKAMLAICTT